MSVAPPGPLGGGMVQASSGGEATASHGQKCTESRKPPSVRNFFHHSVSLTNGFTYVHRRHGPTHPSWCYLRCPNSATCRRPRRHGHPGLRSTGCDSQRTWWRPVPCPPCGWTATLCSDGPLWPSDRVSYRDRFSSGNMGGNLLSGTSSSAQWSSAAFLAPDCAEELRRWVLQAWAPPMSQALPSRQEAEFMAFPRLPARINLDLFPVVWHSCRRASRPRTPPVSARLAMASSSPPAGHSSPGSSNKDLRVVVAVAIPVHMGMVGWGENRAPSRLLFLESDSRHSLTHYSP